MLSKTIQDVASKLGGAKAGGMFRSMMSSTSASFSSAIANNLSPTKSSVQDGAFIDDDNPVGNEGAKEHVDDVGVEAALLEAAYDEEDIAAKFQATALTLNSTNKSTSLKKWIPLNVSSRCLVLFISFSLSMLSYFGHLFV